MSKYEKKIYDIIYKRPRHLSAEDIFTELKQEEPKVVLATVYNNLNSLHAKKLIHKVTVEGMPDRYDSIERHDHLVCSKCGGLVDVMLPDITKKIEKQIGQKIENYDLMVSYVCENCKAQE